MFLFNYTIFFSLLYYKLARKCLTRRSIDVSFRQSPCGAEHTFGALGDDYYLLSEQPILFPNNYYKEKYLNRLSLRIYLFLL